MSIPFSVEIMVLSLSLMSTRKDPFVFFLLSVIMKGKVGKELLEVLVLVLVLVLGVAVEKVIRTV